MKINEKKIINEPCAVIFDWINDIESYQYDLPWCVNSGVLINHSKDHVRGFLEMQIGPFRRKIVTDNTLQPHSKISMTMVEGPFSFFEGYWELKPLSEHHTEVSLFLEVRWSEYWLEKIVEVAYQQLRVQALSYLESALLRRKRV